MIRILIITILKRLENRWQQGTYEVKECVTPALEPYLLIDYGKSRIRLKWLKTFLTELQSDAWKIFNVDFDYQSQNGSIRVNFHGGTL